MATFTPYSGVMATFTPFGSPHQDASRGCAYRAATLR